MAAKKTRKKSKSKRGVQLLGVAEKQSLRRVKKDLLKCVTSIDKTLGAAERMGAAWDKARKRKGWVAGNSPNLIPDFAK